jgi:hypothetical protein
MTGETKSDTIKFRLTPTLEKALQRFATAHALSKTAAVSMLLMQRLRQEKYIK